MPKHPGAFLRVQKEASMSQLKRFTLLAGGKVEFE